MHLVVAIGLVLVAGLATGAVGANLSTHAATASTSSIHSSVELVGSDASEFQPMEHHAVAAAGEGEPPLADAGLDQHTDIDSTVYLDAGGSHAPDGEIESYEWTIERPNGTVTEPDCPTCEQTSFIPRLVGTYHVTVTVTATNGLSDSDTLYVYVSDREPPSATLTGPESVAVSEPADLALEATPGTHPLLSVSWYVDGVHHRSDFLDDDGPWEESFQFADPGVYTITADVVDESGYSTEATHELTVGDDFSHFDVTITSTTSPVADDDDLVVTAVVENTGTVADVQSVRLATADGTTVDNHPGVFLDAGDDTTLTFTWSACLDASVEGVTVSSEDDTDEETVDISEAGCDEGVFSIEQVTAPDSVREGQRVTVTATIENTGTGRDTQLVRLEDIHGRETDEGTARLTLEPGQRGTVQLAWATEAGDSGVGELTVRTDDDEATAPLTVLAGPFFAVDILSTRPVIVNGSDDEIAVKVAVENTGNWTDVQDVVFRDGENGSVRDRHASLALRAGEEETIELRWEVGEFDVSGAYPLYVASADDSDSSLLSEGYEYSWAAWVSDVPEAMYRGQRVRIETLVHRYHAYRYDTDETYYHLAREHENERGSFVTNVRTMSDGLFHVRPVCTAATCEYEADPFLEADSNATLGEGRNVCIKGWTADPTEDGDGVSPPTFSNETEAATEPAGYDPACAYVEIAEEDDDRIEEMGELVVRLEDRQGNPLGHEAGFFPQVTHDGTESWRTVDSNGEVTWSEIGGDEYQVSAEADEYRREVVTEVRNHEITQVTITFEEIYPTGEIEVEVVDEKTGDPIEGARVEIGSESGRTDSSGLWRAMVEATEHEFVVEHSGEYESRTVTVHESRLDRKSIELDVETITTVDVYVDDLQGNPIDGASVDFGGEAWASTNYWGRASESVSTGEHTIEVEKNGASQRTNVEVGADETELVYFTLGLNGQGSLQVSVENEFGTGYPGVTVKENSNFPAFEGVTDSRGEVEFPYLDAGGYEVIAEYGGSTDTATVTIEHGETTHVTLYIFTTCPGCLEP